MYDNWDDLIKEVNNCNKCKLCSNRTKIVFETGDRNASIMIIGDIPGTEEDLNGQPFSNAAGELVMRALDGIGIDKEKIYLTNLLKCRTPSNRTPEDNEICTCLDYLRNQVILIKPKIIVLLGDVVVKSILGKEQELSNIRGQVIDKKGILYLPTWNPKDLLKDENKKIEFWNDLKEVISCK